MIGNDKFVRLFGSVIAGDDEKLIQIVSEAVREGVAIVLNRPGTKIPTCTLTAVERNRANKAAREAAAAINDPNWSKRKHACGLAHALTVKSLTATDENPDGDPTKVRAKVGQIIRRVTKMNNGEQPNIGVELGRSRMLVIDVDTTEEVQGFVNDWKAQDESPIPGMTVKSPGKKNVGKDGQDEWVHKNGGHYWFSIPEDVQLPAGQGAFRAASGWVAMWADHQVLVPPSKREEGPYELIGQVDDSPSWVIAALLHEVEDRMKRASKRVLPDGTGDIDTWSFETPWADLLEADGWTNTKIPDNCSCDIWTAPGNHGYYKSATAHDIGCSRYDSQTSPPLHVWTFNPPEWMLPAFKKLGTTTLTKLRYVAWRDYNGDQKAALVGLGFNQAPVPSSDLNEWSPEPVRGKATKPAPARPAVPSDGFEGDESDPTEEGEEEAEGDAEPEPEEDSDSWRPLDLSSFMDQEERVPTLLPRADGVCFLYSGLMHSIHGEPESGKSWVAQAEVVRLAKLGETSLYLDFENDASMVVHRFIALGATRQDLGFIDYRNPDGKPNLGGAHWNSMFRTPNKLVVIDGMTDALGLFGLGIKDNDEVAIFQRKFKQLARNTGAAVLIIDHVVKDKTARGRYAIGAGAKMAGIDGAAYVVDVVAPMGRGLRGELKILVAKDKPGFVRGKAIGFNSERLGDVGRFVLDATGDKISWELQQPADPFSTPDPELEDVPKRNEGLEILILQELSMVPDGLSGTELASRIGKRKASVLAALAALEADGSVVQSSPAGKAGRQKVVWIVTERGQEEAS
jgi:hypothetical protein